LAAGFGAIIAGCSTRHCQSLMSTLLIHNARCVATFDATEVGTSRELRDASVFIRDHLIEAIGPAAD
jgi:hypothetical protein